MMFVYYAPAAKSPSTTTFMKNAWKIGQVDEIVKYLIPNNFIREAQLEYNFITK